MIAILIQILIALSVGQDICTLGNSIPDWQAFANEHGADMRIVVDYRASSPNFWLYSEGDSAVLFVFKESLDKIIDNGGGAAHGQCARLFSVADSTGE